MRRTNIECMKLCFLSSSPSIQTFLVFYRNLARLMFLFLTQTKRKRAERERNREINNNSLYMNRPALLLISLFLYFSLFSITRRWKLCWINCLWWILPKWNWNRSCASIWFLFLFFSLSLSLSLKAIIMIITVIYILYLDLD